MSFQIVATMGPACSTLDSIRALVREGVTAFRLPLAKETLEWQSQRASLIKRAAADEGQAVKIFADLPGSQPRLSNASPLEVKDNHRLVIFSLNSTQPGNEMSPLSIPVKFWPQTSYPVGSVLVIGDGEVAMKVEDSSQNHAVCKVIFGGVLEQRRGITREAGEDQFQTWGDDTRQHLHFVTNEGLDGVILSFIDRANDIHPVSRILGDSYEIVSKIETAEGLRNLDSIAHVSDLLILGRGDLALQVGRRAFYTLEQEALQKAKANGYKLVVATQLLESASKYWIPNRAELSSLCRFLSMGIDGVLLSTETTISDRPLQVVRVLKELMQAYSPST